MQITLQRRITTQCWQVLAEIGKEQRKELFQAVAYLIDEENLAGNYGKNSIALRISKELLNRAGFKHYGLRLLQRFAEMGGITINPEVRLQQEGRKLIDTGSIAIPQQDTFEITVSNPDALIPASIISYQPVPIGRHNNLVNRALEIRNKTKGKRGKEFFDVMNEVEDQASDLPSHIINLKHRSFELFDGTSIRLNEIEKRGIPGSTPPTPTLHLVVKDTGPDLSLKYKNDEIQFPPPSINPNQVRDQLLSQAKNMIYSPSVAGMLVDESKFKQLNSKTLRSFTMDIEIDNPQLDSMGSFQSTTITDVPLIPASPSVARQWAWYLVQGQITSYIDEDSYIDLCSEISNYSELDRFEFELPSYQELPGQFEFGSPQFWYAQAFRDLPEVQL